MDNQIVCPACRKKITNDPLVTAAVNGESLGTKSIYCECGERITFWAISAQLREQKTFSWKAQNWLKMKLQGRA